MEVKELLKDQLTAKQEEAKRTEERKENYKKTQRFLVTDNFTSLCNTFKEKGNKVFKEIQKEIDGREKAEVLYSSLDLTVQFTAFLRTVVIQLGKTEGEKVYKKYLKEQIDYAESNIYGKVSTLGEEELPFDAPFYTKADMLKQKRIDYLLLDKRLHTISESFFDEKKEKDNANPYKEAK